MSAKTLLPDFTPRGGRTAPSSLLSMLREIDPTAELVYAGRGKWILGSVQPNQIRRRKAENMLGTLLAIRSLLDLGTLEVPKRVIAMVAYRLWYYELVRQGFRIIQAYNFQGEPTSRVWSDFKKRDWFYRHHFEAQLKEFEDAADVDTQADIKINRLREFLEAEHKSIHSHAFRGRKIFTPGPKPKATRPKLVLAR